MAETWDESKPAGSRLPSLGDDDIREFKRAIRERLAEDHVFEATENPAFGAGGGYKIGKHKYATLVAQTVAKTTAADEIALYCKDVSGYKELIITPPSAGTDRQLTKSGGTLINLSTSDFWSSMIATDHLTALCVTNAKLAADCVTTDKIYPLAVTATELGNSSVGTLKIQNNAVTTDKIAALNVTAAKLEDNCITPEKSSHGFIPVLQLPAGVKEFTSDDAGWTTYCTIKIKIPSGPTAVTGQVRMHGSGSGGTANCRIYIGGAVSGTLTFSGQANYAWGSFPTACNLSTGEPGTIHELLVQLCMTSYTAYLDGISLWWE